MFMAGCVPNEFSLHELLLHELPSTIVLRELLVYGRPLYKLIEGLEGGAEGVGVGFDGEFDWARVASAESDDERNLKLARRLHDLAVALDQAGQREFEMAEHVGGERVDAGLIEDGLRLKIPRAR